MLLCGFEENVRQGVVDGNIAKLGRAGRVKRENGREIGRRNAAQGTIGQPRWSVGVKRHKIVISENERGGMQNERKNN